MSAMLAPDLLDRRALALLALVDVTGKAVSGPVRISAAGLRTVDKGSGRHAVIAAPGLQAHEAAFLTPPNSPALRSRRIQIDLTPAAPGLMARRFELRLPRSANAANRSDANSLFQPIEIVLPPSPRAALTGSACAVRVSVTTAGDGRLVEGALVRGRISAGGAEAMTLTDARGEACLIFPAMPLSFAGAGASVTPTTAARVLVHADPATVRLHAPADALAAARAAALRTESHPDPDALASAFPADFATGTAVNLAAGRQLSLALTWAAP